VELINLCCGFTDIAEKPKNTDQQETHKISIGSKIHIENPDEDYFLSTR
jgi:hypothetical protein